MRGEVNEAILRESAAERRLGAGGEIADDPAVAGQRCDPPRLPVGRREAVQVWQGAHLDRRRTVPESFARSLPHRTPARSMADTVIGGGEDRIGEDYDAALS